ncbi:MAG TPA: protein phosphatase 2C domain-containing protein [Dermatophilaceae bacterium]|nr:protein phosphatase 2C domain-containing protein [Dermatophilaceae bacterium]
MTSAGLALRAGIATDVGRVRDHNEDSALARGSIYVVADGMGGHAAGEVASGITTETLGELATRTDLKVADIVAQIEAANERILRMAAQQPETHGMATTVTGVGIVTVGGSQHWAVFNLGDSRVYRYIDGALTQVTVDHSEVQELLDAGYLTAEQAKTHPLRHTVTRSLGRDLLPPVDTWVFPPCPGERFVVCSDGLTNEIDDAEIAAIVGAGDDVQTTAQTLANRAVDHGGRDNVTVVVVELEGYPAADVDEDTTPRGGSGSSAAASEVDETTAPRAPRDRGGAA